MKMKRFGIALSLLLVFAASAHAHFLWIIPTGPNQAKVIFSDSLKPDDPSLLERVTQTKLFGHDKDGKHHDFKFTKTDDGLIFEHPKDVGFVCGSCDYGVFQRGANPPSRLKYFMTFARGEGERPCWDCMPLQVKQEKPGQFLVEFEAKPLADASASLIGPDGFKRQVKQTDADGHVVFDVAAAPAGIYGLCIGHTVKEAGEVGGKKYERILIYSTLVFEKEKAAVEETAEPPADPEATKLLADARAARYVWNNFPGFTANVEVNMDGKVYRGAVSVNEKGKVTFADLSEDAQKWAKPILTSAVGHRLGGATNETPCAFADDVKDHPLGRLVRVLEDEMHSSYRIKDRQVMVVNRDMNDAKFSITMLENKITDNGQYLPASYIVNYWDKDGKLLRSEGHTQTWQRVGALELPKQLRVVSTTNEVKTNSITLSEWKAANGR
jgi:hypothetical protein